MLVYLDMCTLKRPFDDQHNNRIWIETQAVIRILDLFSAGAFRICHSDALIYENRNNPNPLRRERVDALLKLFGKPAKTTPVILTRAKQLQNLDFAPLDALHIAFAEKLHADIFVTCDDGILARSVRNKCLVRIYDPPSFIKEITV